MNSINNKENKLLIELQELKQKYESLTIAYQQDIAERQQSEEKLLSSMSLLNASLESTANGILVVNTSGHITLWNQKFVDLWKVPNNLLKTDVKDPVLDYVLQQVSEPDMFIAKVINLYHNPEMTSVDILNLWDGRIFERYSQPQKIGDNIIGRVWSFRDITLQKQAEDALKDSEFKFKSLSENSNDFIMRIDRNYRHLYINSAGLKFLGLTLDEIIGKSHRESGVYNSEQCDKWEQQIETVFQTKQEIFKQLRIEIKNKIYFLDRRLVPEFNKNNEIVSVLAVSRDISAQKLIENKLLKKNIALLKSKKNAEESEEKYKQIFDNTLDQIFLYDITEDKHLKLIDYNPALRKLVGEIEDYKYKYIEECMAPEIYEQVFHNYQRCLVERKTIVYEETINLQGKIYYFSTQLIPLFDKNNVLHRIIGITRNITENKLLTIQLIEQNEKLKLLNNSLIIAKEQAEESDKLKSAFLANLSHEIRTPMNGILCFSNLLKEPELTGKEQQEYIQIIQKSWMRMLNIINDIVDISKIESGQMELNISKINLRSLFESIYTFYKPEVEDKKLEFNYINNISENDIIILSDDEKIYAILAHLVKNAIKFTNTGSIEYGSCRKENHIEFYVKDTGIGISKQHYNIIFERFRQASELLARDYEGAGLGLSISKAYVEMLDGNIWVESDIGKGSTFYFTIPCDSSSSINN